MLDAKLVREKMNKCGKSKTPFLFGVDFEMQHGFFIDHPLEKNSLLFKAGEVTNFTPAQSLQHKAKIVIKDSDFIDYQRKFDIVHKGLLYGNSFLLNLTERTPIETNLTLEEIFYHSKAKYKIWLPDRFVCFSPETFIKIENNRIFSFPMKGTADANLEDAENLLLNNYKEKCEHFTIVDLIRNDLNIVAEDIKVNRFRYVEKIKTLKGEILQTSSEISGTLPDDWKADIGNIIFQILPAGSISGAPKTATVRLIKDSEGISRGYYTGVFGYFDGNSLDSAVMIRFIEQEGNDYFFRSGGGITINSKAHEEYEEVLEKIYLSI